MALFITQWILLRIAILVAIGLLNCARANIDGSLNFLMFLFSQTYVYCFVQRFGVMSASLNHEISAFRALRKLGMHTAITGSTCHRPVS